MNQYLRLLFICFSTAFVSSAFLPFVFRFRFCPLRMDELRGHERNRTTDLCIAMDMVLNQFCMFIAVSTAI